MPRPEPFRCCSPPRLRRASARKSSGSSCLWQDDGSSVQVEKVKTPVKQSLTPSDKTPDRVLGTPQAPPLGLRSGSQSPGLTPPGGKTTPRVRRASSSALPPQRRSSCATPTSASKAMPVSPRWSGDKSRMPFFSYVPAMQPGTRPLMEELARQRNRGSEGRSVSASAGAPPRKAWSYSNKPHGDRGSGAFSYITYNVPRKQAVSPEEKLETDTKRIMESGWSYNNRPRGAKLGCSGLFSYVPRLDNDTGCEAERWCTSSPMPSPRPSPRCTPRPSPRARARDKVAMGTFDGSSAVSARKAGRSASPRPRARKGLRTASRSPQPRIRRDFGI
eukprot:TRINITY_DN680_c0_g2_i1.p1 TRINITY_DN680_c0_g2~~TRINITY_DN680_c0_g2_i1.p1  ORF type:complete len:332 (+),score=20.19 TRINITY_DN680_c0_g2_i1:86-1081(+)